MEVMDPDNVSILDISSDSFGKDSVGFLVCQPGFLAEIHLTRMIVEDRPQNGIWCRAISSCQSSWGQGNVTREAIVVAVCKLVVEENWYRSKVVPQPTGKGYSLFFRNL